MERGVIYVMKGIIFFDFRKLIFHKTQLKMAKAKKAAVKKKAATPKKAIASKKAKPGKMGTSGKSSG